MTAKKPHHVTFRRFPSNQREYAFCASCAPARLRKSAWIASASHEKFGVCSPCKERIERMRREAIEADRRVADFVTNLKKHAKIQKKG